MATDNDNNGSKLLIIDDDKNTTVILNKMLALSGHESVTPALSPSEAFELLKKNEYDLIISDIEFENDISGIEFAERLKDEYEIPLIFLSAHSDPDLIAEAKATQPYAYLVKPFRQEILQSLSNWLFTKQRLTSNSSLYATN